MTHKTTNSIVNTGKTLANRTKTADTEKPHENIFAYTDPRQFKEFLKSTK